VPFFARLKHVYLSQLGNGSGGPFNGLPDQHVTERFENRAQPLSNVPILEGGGDLWVDFRIDADLREASAYLPECSHQRQWLSSPTAE
jgi:hypothetical protein